MKSYRTVRRFARTRYYAGRCLHTVNKSVIWFGERVAEARGWLKPSELDRWEDL